MTARPRVALVATGGTLASQGAHPLDVQDYAASGRPILDAQAILAGLPLLQELAEILPVPFSTIPSTALTFADWRRLVAVLTDLARTTPDLAGIVITHGTSTLEETAYLLSLTLPFDLPVVITGAQRPFTGLSTDAFMNLVAAVRVASSPQARGLGVLVVLNDEIHAAREVTKTSNGRLQTFQSPGLGVLGHADADAIALWRRPTRLLPVDQRIDITGLAALPRVDVVYSVAGGDGVAVPAFVAAGAAGIVVAGLAPGAATPAERAALEAAIGQGVVVLMSSRAGSGRVFATSRYVQAGFLHAADLNPQKARIALMLALVAGRAGVAERLARM